MIIDYFECKGLKLLVFHVTFLGPWLFMIEAGIKTLWG